MKNSIYFGELLKLLSIEYNCSEDDFKSDKNIITVSALRDGRRNYSNKKDFFRMVTLGSNAVITADKQLHGFLAEFAKDRAGHWLFEFPNLLPLEKELNLHGYTLSQTAHMFLPSGHQNPNPASDSYEDFQIKWFFGEEIHRFYGNPDFPNAICSEYLPHRPDRAVVCAVKGEKIIAMAGCSEDAPRWMQIGIDVLPEYRSRGIGSLLVSLLKNMIEQNGDIPFYGTSLSNYHSWNIALNCGFYPAWVEIHCSHKNMADFRV